MMYLRGSIAALLIVASVANVVMAGCTQTAATTPTSPPTAVKAAEPTKPAAPAATPKPAEPTKAADAAKKVEFPTKGKSISFMVPWAAGGSTDVTGRLIAAGLEKELGIPVPIVNKSGASSQVGMTEFVRTKPDGYSLIITSIPSVLTPYMDPERKAIYSRKDIQQVANVGWDPEVVAIPNASPHKTLKEMIDFAKANPEKLKIATTGLQSDTHLAIMSLQKAADVKFNIVHLEGIAGVIAGLLGGHVDACIMSGSGLSAQVKSGELRPLGIMDKQESKYFPGLKTLESQGYKLYWSSSRGVSVPAGTPKEIVDILAGAIKKTTEDESFKKKMDDMLQTILYMGPEQYTTYWDEVEALAKPFIVPTK